MCRALNLLQRHRFVAKFVVRVFLEVEFGMKLDGVVVGRHWCVFGG